MTRSKRSRDEGFSLLEVMAVVAILSVLVLVAVGSYVGSVAQSRRIACVHNQRTMDTAIMQYQLANNGANPPTLASLAGLAKWSGPRFGTCVSDGTPFVYAPLTGAVSCPNHPR